MTTAGAVEKLFADAVAAVGKPDIAINTVGKVLKKPMVDIRSRVRRDDRGQRQTAFFFLKEAGKHLNDNGKICTLVTLAARRLHAVLCRLRRHQGAGGALHPRRRQGVRRARHLQTAVGPRARWTPRSSIRPKAPMRWRITKARRRCRRSANLASPISDGCRLSATWVSDGWWVTGQTI
ncbi:hypothetical protein M8494_31075 [Serratia ureilytica]